MKKQQSTPLAQAKILGRKGATTLLSMAVGAGLMLSSSNLLVVPAQADPVFVQASPHNVGFADLIDAVKPAVVSVLVKGQRQRARPSIEGPMFDMLPDDHPLKRFFNERQRRGQPRADNLRPARPIGQGSGFFISEDGYIATNNHVVRGGSEFTVIMTDGKEYQATLVGSDSRTDVAVLKVEADQKFTYADFADDSTLRIGDWVVAIGNPLGLGGTVTVGVVSARGRDMGATAYDDFLQIDAAINPGNSGGPSFNMNGQVVGINTMIVSPTGGNIGLGFAVPASTARTVIDQLIKTGSVERGWIGVQIQPVSKELADSVGLAEAKGAIVAEAMDDGPAAHAGIKVGDVILSVNDHLVADSRDLARTIAMISPNEEAVLGVWRDGKKIDITITIAAMPDSIAGGGTEGEQAEPESLADYGLTVTPADDGNGAVVTNVDPDSDASDKGIRPGDIIRRVNNATVNNAADIVGAITEAQKAGRGAVLMQVETNGQNRFIAISIQQRTE